MESCEELNCAESPLCVYSLSVYCTVCSQLCDCPLACKTPNAVMERILGYGDENYRSASEYYAQISDGLEDEVQREVISLVPDLNDLLTID